MSLRLALMIVYFLAMNCKRCMRWPESSLDKTQQENDMEDDKWNHIKYEVFILQMETEHFYI